MPIDEDVLESTITNIINETQDNFNRGVLLRALHVAAVSIRLVDKPDVSTEDAQDQEVLPLDTELGTTITEDRRQAIYDKIMSDFSGLT